VATKHYVSRVSRMIKSAPVIVVLMSVKRCCEGRSSTVSSMKAVCFGASGVDAVSSPGVEFVWS